MIKQHRFHLTLGVGEIAPPSQKNPGEHSPVGSDNPVSLQNIPPVQSLEFVKAFSLLLLFLKYGFMPPCL